jgi:hypothetical protein
VENVIEGKPPAVTCADGVAALQASAAATLSFKENRPVDDREMKSKGSLCVILRLHKPRGI